MNRRTPSVFPAGTSLGKLLQTLERGWKINLFYLVDEVNQLTGVVSRKEILEYLSPVYLMADRNQLPSINKMNESVPAEHLARKEYDALSIDSNLPEVLKGLLCSEYSALPVVDFQGRLMGEVTLDGLLHSLSLEDKETLNAVS